MKAGPEKMRQNESSWRDRQRERKEESTDVEVGQGQSWRRNVEETPS